MALTSTEIDNIVDRVVSRLQANAKTIEQLPTASAMAASDYIELSGGYKASLEMLRKHLGVNNNTAAMETAIANLQKTSLTSRQKAYLQSLMDVDILNNTGDGGEVKPQILYFNGFVTNVSLILASAVTTINGIYFDKARGSFVCSTGGLIAVNAAEIGGGSVNPSIVKYYPAWGVYPTSVMYNDFAEDTVKTRLYVNTSDGKMYRYVDGSLVKSVSESDVEAAKEKWIDVTMWIDNSDVNHIVNDIQSWNIAAMLNMSLAEIASYEGVRITDGYGQRYYLRWGFISDDTTEIRCSDFYYKGARFAAWIDDERLINLKYKETI